MAFFRQLRFRLGALFRRRQLEAEMAEEMRQHLARRVEENIAAGLPPEEARYAAQRAFGGLGQIQEQCRDARRFAWMEQVAQDVRHAARSLRQTPGFTAVVLLTLALGIGANTAAFSLVDAVLLRSLPVRNPEELVLFKWVSEAGGRPRWADSGSRRDPATGEIIPGNSFSVATFEAFRRHNETLSDVFAFGSSRDGASIALDGQVEIVPHAQFVSGGYHRGLGVRAAAGRLLTPDDDRPGAAAAGVISHRYWLRRFAGDPAAVGKTVLVNNTPVTLVGVTAPGFAGTLEIDEFVDLTLPLALSLDPQVSGRPGDGRQPDNWWIRIMGRLKPGVSPAQARANLEGLFQETARGQIRGPRPAPGEPPAPPPEPATLKLRADPGEQGLTEARQRHERSLHLLLGLVGLVLLIACANVANLLLARGAARRREIAVRLSLGASRRRIVAQLLAESLLLASLGAMLGVVLAVWGRDALLALHPLGADGGGIEAPLDLRVLGFTSIVAVATGGLFGLVPALRATRVNLSAEFQGGARTLGAGAGTALAKSLMGTQVALSLVLLIGAGLFVRTLQNLQDVDAGFEREHLLMFELHAAANGAPPGLVQDVYRQVAARLAGVPGVLRAGYSHHPLLSESSSWDARVTIAGRPPSAGESVSLNFIDPGFIATLGLPIVHGRGFTAADAPKAPRVALVNQAFVRAFFRDENPIGRRIEVGGGGQGREIVGVVRDARYFTVKEPPPPTVYQPFAQQSLLSAHFVVRLAGPPAAILPGIRAAVRETDATLPLRDVRTQEEQFDRLFTQERLFASLCSFFGALALLLAAIGLYGLMSYAVVQRTGEIGLRMALGAQPGGVLWMIVRESLVVVALGVVAGFAAAWGASRWIASMLFGLSATDPLTYFLLAGVLVGVALLAAWLPARRASRVDPMEALRAD